MLPRADKKDKKTVVTCKQVKVTPEILKPNIVPLQRASTCKILHDSSNGTFDKEKQTQKTFRQHY